MHRILFILMLVSIQNGLAEFAKPFASLSMRPGMSVAANREDKMRLGLTSNGLCATVGVRTKGGEWYVRAARESTGESVDISGASHYGPDYGYFSVRESDRMSSTKFQTGGRWLFAGNSKSLVRSFVGAGLTVGSVEWIRDYYSVSHIEDTDTYYDRDGEGHLSSLIGYFGEAGTRCKLYKTLSAEFTVSCGINYISVSEEDNYGSDVITMPDWYMFIEPLASFGLRWDMK